MTVKELIEVLQKEVKESERDNDAVISYGPSYNITIRHISTIQKKGDKIFLL